MDYSQYENEENQEEKGNQFYYGQKLDDEKQKSETKTQTFSTITNKKTSTVQNTSEEANVSNIIGIKGLPYQDTNEISEIKIINEDNIKYKNGNHFVNSTIKAYLNNINNFNDDKFNICRYCNANNNNVYYCVTCQKNLCVNCIENNNEWDHELIRLADLDNDYRNKIIEIVKIISKIFEKPEQEKIKEKSAKIRSKNEIDSEIDQNKNQIDYSIENYIKQDDLELIERIIGKKYINYFHYKNILECKKYLENRYKKCFKEGCLLIKYNIQELHIGNEIQLFGDDFVENNREKFFLIINNEYLPFASRTIIRDEYLEVILVQKLNDEEQNNPVINLSFMFQNCDRLKGFEVFKDHKLNFNKVNNISFMFDECTQIETIDLTSFGSIEKLEKMVSVFSECSHLKEINGLMDLKTDNVKSMANMFEDCLELTKINGIENFNTQNVSNFSKMFYNCQSLSSIPNINKWNMENAENLKEMFKDCIRLNKLPKISEWGKQTKNIKTMEGMFYGCVALQNLPDLSGWDMRNVENIEDMFRNCRSLAFFNISQWNLGKTVLKKRIFQGCPNFNH